ncbi:MAG: hypothetical protein ACO3H5_04560 [Candidatus Nanopelagicales bacterium]
MKALASVISIISMRSVNVLANAAVGVVLARQLNLSDRGYVAAISSVVGIAVILLSSPKGEEILKNRQKSPWEKIPIRITFHFWQFVIVALISICYFLFTINLNLTFLACVLICTLIYSSSVNGLRQAFMFHKFGVFGHQLAVTLHSIIYASFLLSAFTFIDANVNVWLLAFLCTELLLFTALWKINNNLSIDLKINSVWKDQRKFGVAKKGFIEKISVYLAAFYLQLTIISVSIFYPADLLAYFAIGISLTTLVSLPLTPFLPKVLSMSKKFITEFRSLRPTKVLLILIGVFFYLVGAIKVFQIFIPILFGPKYYLLVGYVPVIVLCGLMVGCNSFILMLLRGLKKYLLSFIISTLGLVSFTLGVMILVRFKQGIYQTFLMFMVSNLVCVLVGILVLLSRKVVKL